MNTGAEVSLFGPTLDVAIGLVLIYVLYSLLLSTVVEALASIAKLRPRALETAILRLIDDPQPPAPAKTSMIGKSVGMFRTKRRGAAGQPAGMAANAAAIAAAAAGVAALTPPTLGEKVYGHALFAGMAGKNRPSYVASEHFTSALLDVLREASNGSLFSDSERAIAVLPHGPLRQALGTIVREAQGDWNLLRHGVESWYAGAMDRLTGDYKRFIQTATFILGFVLAVAANVDSIALVKSLWVEKDLRAALVTRAETEVQHPLPANATFRRNAPRVQLPPEIATRRAQLLEIAPRLNPYASFPSGEFVVQVVGWLLTALAGMLGAPFWFELLQRLVNLRGAGPKPDVRKPAKT